MTAKDSSGAFNSQDLRFVRNVLLKAIFLFVIVNFVFATFYPMRQLGRVSAYNHLFPGRKRLPYGENPQRAYNLSLFNLEAMFASHELARGNKPDDEYRVILIGDSSTWGFLLPANQTLSAYINAAELITTDGRRVRAFNLGYPVMSLTKDLVILSYAKRYEPDLIIWPLTLESFPLEKQLYPSLLQNNPDTVREIINSNGMNLAAHDEAFKNPSFWSRTIIGSRRELADLVRLQLYGVLWAATGVDQDIPETYTPRMEDLPADQKYSDFTPPHLKQSDLAFDVLSAGVKIAGDIPVLFVNEPMFISQGENSDVRYNFYYPRWAYDDYRTMLVQFMTANGWAYRDMWDIIDGSEFTNSAVHLTPEGSEQFSQKLAVAIIEVNKSIK